jgi:hypothetical protein
MNAKVFRIVAITLVLLLPSAALAQVPKIGGTWRAVVLKKKGEKVPLTKDGSSLLITINQKAKTWEATTKTGDKKQTTSGTFEFEADHAVFLESGGSKHLLNLYLDGDQLVFSPKADPDIRLVAMRVR